MRGTTRYTTLHKQHTFTSTTVMKTAISSKKENEFLKIKLTGYYQF